MADLPQIHLTQDDIDRCAQVVPREKLPKDAVTMNSRVVFEDAAGEPG